MGPTATSDDIHEDALTQYRGAPLTQYLAASAYVRAHTHVPHKLVALRPHTLGVCAYLRAHPHMLSTAQSTRAHVVI